MVFNILPIVKQFGASLEISVRELLPNLNEASGQYIFKEPVEVEGKVTNVGDRLVLKANVRTEYETICTRCAEPITKQVDIEIEEDFIPQEQLEPYEEDFVYERDKIDISKAVADNILLSIPIEQLCKEDCKGVCMVCGTNLNHKSCDCEEQAVNPAMEKLKNFFKE